jgi:hypothetical protein
VQDERILILHDMQDAPILDVRVLADPYVMNVSADDRIEPHARVIADFNISDDLRSVGDEDPVSKFGKLSFVIQQHTSKRPTLTEAINGIQGTPGEFR